MVRSDDIERLHKRIGRAYAGERGRPFAANAAVRFLRGMFNLARSKNVYKGAQNPARTGKKRGDGIKLFPEPPRTRYLSDDEIDRVRAALEEESEEWQAFFSLLLLLGVRRGELLTARWENLGTGLDFTPVS
jgi:integrase